MHAKDPIRRGKTSRSGVWGLADAESTIPSAWNRGAFQFLDVADFGEGICAADLQPGAASCTALAPRCHGTDENRQSQLRFRRCAPLAARRAATRDSHSQ